jgi:uncharacterized protein with PIN domain
MTSPQSIRPQSEFRFHGRLDRFLAPSRRGHGFAYAFDGTPAVKDPIEALGVPHTEVGRLLIDDGPARLDRLLVGSERIDVFPVEVAPADRPRRFVLDVHLGRLAGYLRLLGIDVLYRNDLDDGSLLAVSIGDRRTLLSRDTGLLKRRQLTDGAFVYETDPRLQLRETVERFGLHDCFAPFSRCTHCNGLVEPIDAVDAASDVPASVLRNADRFSRCPDCRRVYWRGTHEARLRQRLAEVGLHV